MPKVILVTKTILYPTNGFYTLRCFIKDKQMEKDYLYTLPNALHGTHEKSLGKVY
jgi:hypothetical protein